ncbi:hypothetical protein B0A48_07636 [Cryoendolithus antarcticus]|uniref:Uncharacterized protein n=1 Tax=Cryoendolithus antarcticus TaxID=1507870 RepID=A0A1V8T6U7_9PEZI|nr:hypothetical protein B0A48_07636 [Cryoendolithus antarcticus]
MRPSLILRSAGGKIPYPKHVWSPAGGWYAQPANWKANTAIMLGVVSGVVAMAWSVSANREHRYKMPEHLFGSREALVVLYPLLEAEYPAQKIKNAFVLFLCALGENCQVLKASAPSWKCEVFANEGTILEDEWERGHFEDHRAIFTTAQYRTIKERLETEIEKCWFEVASEMSIFTEREFEIGEVKALYELHHGGKSGAEAGIVNGLARLEV